MALPACDAWIVHVPAAIRVTVAVATVQTAVVVEEKLTVRPDDAVALTVNGAAPYVWPVSAANVMVCAVCARTGAEDAMSQVARLSDNAARMRVRR